MGMKELWAHLTKNGTAFNRITGTNVGGDKHALDVAVKEITGVTVNQGPTSFNLDLTETEVEKDTGTPANNIPLPVEVIDTTGVVDLRALLTTGNILAGVTWDHFALTETATTDTYTYRTGGSGGTITAVILITYTASNKKTVATIERTT